MKKFENPEILIAKFDVEDVITTSIIEGEEDMTDKG